MDLTTLGRTGLRVSRMGLGGGGHSRLGLSQGKSESEAEAIVKAALDLGINFIDTAEGYRTEEVVGRGIAGIPRDRVVISTKAGVHWQDRLCTASELAERVDACLRRLQTDYVDVFHLHGLALGDYDFAVAELVPALINLKEAGKIRHIGVTEQFINDPSHRMLQRALQDDIWEVVMVGFNLLNPSARRTVVPVTQSKGIGTLCMFAVRRALSRPEALRELLAGLVAKGALAPDAFDPDDPLGFAWRNGVARSLQEAAYRFCRWEPGLDVILSGTGNIEHLKSNRDALMEPPLPVETQSRLEQLFGQIDSVSGN